MSTVFWKRMHNPSHKSVQGRVSFSFIRYANCWEDADVLCEALVPSAGKRILSIASAGDNSLALLAEGAEVVAADLSLPQLACLELRRAAFRRLDYAQVLAFLGVRAADDRPATYLRLRGGPFAARRTVSGMSIPAFIAAGIIHTGKMEAYFRSFRRWVLPCIHSRRMVDRLLQPKDRASQGLVLDEVGTTAAGDWLFGLFFNRFLMGRLGRDPEFFRYVETGVAQHFLERARHGLTVLPTHTNPFLDYIAYGNFTRTLPRYLRPEQFDKVRSGLDRLTLYHGSIEQAGQAHRNERI